MTKDNGQAGYDNAPAGQWSLLQSGWEGTSRTHTATNNEKVSASWMLGKSTGIPRATYAVFVTYPPSASNTTVQYNLYDGQQNSKGFLGSVTVDQTATPTDGTYQNATWKSLGRFQVKSGNLIVTMNGTVTAPTKNMVADGVLLIPAGSTQGPQGPADRTSGPGLAQQPPLASLPESTRGEQAVGPTPASQASAPVRGARTPPTSGLQPTITADAAATLGASSGAASSAYPLTEQRQPAANPSPIASPPSSEAGLVANDPRVSWVTSVANGKKARSQPDTATTGWTGEQG
jgi:hypothetical protein